MQPEYIVARQQRASDYFLENERLTRNLTDSQATPLIEWASHQARQLAADPARSDQEVEELIGALRRAIVQAGRAAAAEPDPYRLLLLARQAFAAEAGIPASNEPGGTNVKP